MGDFFHSWRRKIGCVTLVMACFCAAMWVRSIGCADRFFLPYGTYTLAGVISAHGNLLIFHQRFDDALDSRRPQVQAVIFDRLEFQLRILKGVGWERSGTYSGDEIIWYRIPYFAIVIPMTLLSVWLLFTKPRILNPEGSATNQIDLQSKSVL